MPLMWEDLQEAPSRSDRWKATLRKQPSAFLLAVQILVILLLPVLESSSWGAAVISLLSLSALITAVFTVRSTPALTWLSATLALPAAVFEIWSLIDDSSTVVALAHSALAVFYFYTAYALISYMFEDSWVTKDELFAVGACFTVLVFAFAYLFMAIQEVYPQSFTSFDGPGKRTLLELIYYSGPTSPVSACPASGRSGRTHEPSGTVEQLAGVMYVAMVISRTVALTVRARSTGKRRRRRRSAVEVLDAGQAGAARGGELSSPRLGLAQHPQDVPLVRAARSVSLQPRSASAASRRGYPLTSSRPVGRWSTPS